MEQIQVQFDIIKGIDCILSPVETINAEIILDKSQLIVENLSNIIYNYDTDPLKSVD